MRNFLTYLLILTFTTSVFAQTGQTPAYDKAGRKMDAPLLLKDQTSTTASPSGYKSLYPKADGKFYFKDSAGLETPVGTGSGGGGGTNYFTNPNADTDITGVKVINGNASTTSTSSTVDELGDSINVGQSLRFIPDQKIYYVAGTTVIGGLTNNQFYYVKNPTGNSSSMSFQLSATRGGPVIDLTSDGAGTQTFWAQEVGNGEGDVQSTLTRTTTAPLNSSSSFLYSKSGADRRGDQIVAPFSVPLSRQGTTISVGLDYVWSAPANVSDGDWQVTVVDLVNKKYVYGPTTLPKHLLPSGNFTFNVPTTSGSGSYALILAVISPLTFSYDLKFGGLTAAPKTSPVGDVVQTEYVYNSSGITAAGASNATAFATGEQGAAIGNIVSDATSASYTSFMVQFSDEIRSTDEVTLEFANPSVNQWLPIGAITEIQPSQIINALAKGVSITLYSLSRQVQVQFGNSGRQANAGYSWTQVASWRWRVKRTRVIKNVALSSENSGVRTVFKGSKTTNFSVPVGTAETVVSFENISSDSISSYSAGSYTIKETDDYDISGACTYDSVGNTVVQECYIYTGPTLAAYSANNGGSAAYVTTHVNAGVVRLTQGTVVQLRTRHSSNSAKNLIGSVGTYLSIKKSAQGGQQIAASDPVAIRFMTSAGQSVPNVSNTVIAFATPDRATHPSSWDGTSFTAPASGWYQVNGHIAFGAYTTDGEYLCGIWKGSVSTLLAAGTRNRNNPSGFSGAHVSDTIYLAQGEKIGIYAYQNRGSAWALSASVIDNYISIVRVAN